MYPKLISLTPEEFLASFDKFGIHLGLDRILQLLNSLGNPHQQIPVIHVAGTNGKGSVCAFLLSILQEAGYRVGRYTSPHLLDWRERISINGEWISEENLSMALSQVESVIDADFLPTQFEVITAAMWWYFAQQKALHNLDIAIIETGLGGRLDATNVCDRPLVCAITSIGLDHCQQLGNTLGEIATEKAGIIKPKCPVVIAESHPEALMALQAKARDCNAPVTWVSAAERKDQGAIWKGFEYPLPLLGNHQLINSAIAIAAIQSLRTQDWQISDNAIWLGMTKAEWVGRLQWINIDLNGKNCKILIDGAHNVAAAECLRQFVDEAFPDQQKRWVIGILNTKDQYGILKPLLHPDDLFFAVPVANSASTLPQDLVKLAMPMIKNLPQAYASLELGLEAAFDNMDLDLDDIVILCGSLYLVGELLSLKK